MRILALADIHGHTKNIPALAPAAGACDVIVLAGDITDFGGREQAEAVLSALCALGPLVMGVSGNCDPPAVDQVLREWVGELIDTPAPVDDVLFVGAPYRASDAYFSGLSQKMSEYDAGKVVLVSHEPALGTDVDVQASIHHKGSQAVRSFIELHQPTLAVSGHIHEACGTDQLGDTLLVNPGPFRNGRYAIIDIGEKSVQAKLHWL